MSAQFPSMKAQKVIKILERLGFECRRVTGSHHIFRHPQKGNIIPVPVHGNKDLKKGTLRSIIKHTGLSIDEFISIL